MYGGRRRLSGAELRAIEEKIREACERQSAKIIDQPLPDRPIKESDYPYFYPMTAEQASIAIRYGRAGG